MHLHQDTLISLYKVLALPKKLANIVWLSFKWREQTDHHNFSMYKRRVNRNDEDPGLSFAKIKIRRVSTSKPSYILSPGETSKNSKQITKQITLQIRVVVVKLGKIIIWLKLGKKSFNYYLQ